MIAGDAEPQIARHLLFQARSFQDRCLSVKLHLQHCHVGDPRDEDSIDIGHDDATQGSKDEQRYELYGRHRPWPSPTGDHEYAVFHGPAPTHEQVMQIARLNRNAVSCLVQLFSILTPEDVHRPSVPSAPLLAIAGVCTDFCGEPDTTKQVVDGEHQAYDLDECDDQHLAAVGGEQHVAQPVPTQPPALEHSEQAEQTQGRRYVDQWGR
mmetsp:Transcript_15218/g.31919  ORF Transcript_15218/g.31919 Transcript_15218/m.31919 type:complete len:209 (-) Transcript_15218:596-1222(-)